MLRGVLADKLRQQNMLWENIKDENHCCKLFEKLFQACRGLKKISTECLGHKHSKENKSV